MISEELRDKLNGLASRLKDASTYVDDPLYGFIPESVAAKDRQWGSFVDTMGGIKTTIGNRVALHMVKPPNGQERDSFMADQVMEQSNFTSFSLLGQGNSTIVMLAKSDEDMAVLRISGHTDSYLAETAYRDDYYRPEFPGLLQPMSEKIAIGDKALQAEVLPPIQVIELESEDRRTYQAFLEELTEGTVYHPQIAETMILPDGTLMCFDPGECHYTDEYWDLEEDARVHAEAQSKDVIALRLKSWDLPAELNPLDQDGASKQHAFFTLAEQTMQNDLSPDGHSLDEPAA